MKKYELLIVDDEFKERAGKYEKSLDGDFFDIKFIENASASELDRLRTSGDGVLLDIDLEKWASKRDKPELFRKVAAIIGKSKPTFLVSSKWDPDNIEWVNKSKDVINIRHYLSWPYSFHDDLQMTSTQKALYNPLRDNLKKELDEFYERDGYVIEKDE